MFDCPGLMEAIAFVLAHATQLGLAHNSFLVLNSHNPIIVALIISFIKNQDSPFDFYYCFY